MKKMNQKGQALIELIIFLPLMFMFYAIVSSFANAINGSINQQKITRSYLYFRLQNHSYIIKPDEDNVFRNWKTFGMFFNGYMDDTINNFPVAPCYKVNIPMAPNNSDKCETPYANATTQFIRVQTVYGICGATYLTINNEAVLVPDNPGTSFTLLKTVTGCNLTR